jgi:alpha-glucan,water dikinase
MPQITGFPSKRIGLFIKQSVIFRSDSNGEDLEGYAGAGLYDR